MGHSHNRIWIHALWLTKNRAPLIQPLFENELFDRIKQEFKKFDCNAIVVNGMPDHIHILFWLHPSISIASILKQVKGTSSRWINQEKLCQNQFAWQREYVALSVQYNNYERVEDYINNQKQHHAKRNLVNDWEQTDDSK